LARRQHVVVARAQLLRAGIGRRAIGGRLERGSLHPVHLGVYAVGHPLLSLEARWMAAVLASGPGAVLSHRAAGRLWGVTPRLTASPEVSRPRAFRSGRAIVAHCSPVPGDEASRVDGIPVTSVSRTLLDLAGVLTRAQLEQALNEADVLGLTDRLSVVDLLERYPRRRGSAVLRALFRDDAAVRGVTRSAWSSGSRRFLQRPACRCRGSMRMSRSRAGSSKSIASGPSSG
jgi:hypothetical protein